MPCKLCRVKWREEGSRLGLGQSVDGWLAVKLQSSILELHMGTSNHDLDTFLMLMQ